MEDQATSEAIFRFAAIVDSSDDSIISKTLEGFITSWNPAAERLFGYTETEAVGKHISLILPKDRLHEEETILEQISNGERIKHYETIRRKKNGQLIPVSLSISPVKNSEGKIIGAAKIVRDITHYKSSEEKNAILAAIVGSSDDAIISKNLQGIITSWNRGAESVLGYTEEEAVGRHISLIIPDERISEEAMIIQKIKEGEKIEHFETKRRMKNGQYIDLSITVSPVKNEKGTIIGASKIARDISERIRVQQQIEAYTEELKRLNRYKDEFISVASHELNTPLTSLKVYLQLLQSNMASGNIDMKKNDLYNEKALNITGKLAKLVKDLLDVSRIEVGQMNLQIENFDVIALLDDTIENIKPLSRKHEIIYEGSRQPISISGDKDRLDQAFINIMSNAIKYSPDADRIIIRTEEKNNTVSISVVDFGIGIPERQIPFVFNRFFRAEGMASSYPGLGIGLYLAHQIITRHNGKIEVSSEEGKGSVFTIVLPLDPDQ